MKTIIDEVKRLNNDIDNTITELVKARLAHNDVAVANAHHKMESLMVETQQVCSFIIDNPPSEDLEEAADYYLDNIPTAELMYGDYEGPDVYDAFIAGAQWQKEQMMKSAVDALVYEDTENVDKKTLFLIGEQRDTLNIQLSNYEYGETVKLIVIKEDEQ